MNACPQCRDRASSSQSYSRNLAVKSMFHSAGILFSSMTLILMPKCPICVAAYVTILTGMSLTTGAAEWIRAGLITVCAATLVLLTVRGIQRKWRPASSRH